MEEDSVLADTNKVDSVHDDSIESLLQTIADESISSILECLNNINTKQHDVFDTLSTISDSINNNFSYDGSIFSKPTDKNFIDVDSYRIKISRLKKVMQLISDRSKRLQTRLNVIRKDCTANRTHLVQKGPFHYKCIHRGGIRYREFPSTNAKYIASKVAVVYNEHINVSERVFINGESSVFLHVTGVGWLAENKGTTIFLELSTPPDKSSDNIIIEKNDEEFEKSKKLKDPFFSGMYSFLGNAADNNKKVDSLLAVDDDEHSCFIETSIPT